MIDCMMAPPRSRWRSAVPDAMPARAHGHGPRQRVGCRRAREADTSAYERVAEPHLPVRAVVAPEQQHGEEAEEDEHVSDEERHSGALGLDELRRPRRAISTMNTAAGMIAMPASRLEYCSTFCRYCCPTYIAPIKEPNTMMPAQAATQKMRPNAMSRSYSGIGCVLLPDDEADPGRDRHGQSPKTTLLSFGTRAKLMAKINAADHERREHTAEVVDRFGGLVHMARHEQDGEHERDAGEGQGHEEHRAPPEVLEECARHAAVRAQRSHRRGPDHKAIDFVRAGPDQSAVMSASVVG